MTLALIAAQSENRVIGRGREIPWRVKGEQALFKKLTLGGTLIMGRRTFESIGRPLPGRRTIVISRNPAFAAAGCLTATGLAAALKQARALDGPVFVAGGGELYRQTIGMADALHLTTIHAKFDGDVYFPPVPDDYRLLREEHHTANIDYTYRYFEKSQ